jgi:hypothetical protein
MATDVAQPLPEIPKIHLYIGMPHTKDVHTGRDLWALPMGLCYARAIKAILQLHELGNRCQRRVNLIYTASATTVEKCQAHSENTSETCHGIEIAQAHLSIL